MWIFSQGADWWDEKKSESSEYLHEFVEEHDHWWAIAIAGTVETAMRLGGGFVDVLRLGDGVRSGTWRGLLHDGLRLLSLAGPFARLGRGIARVLAPRPGGPICGWVSATQALRQTGVQHFATVEDIAAATGKVPGPTTMSELEGVLRSAGAEVRPLAAADMAAVNELAKANPHGVVMFGVEWFSKVLGKTVGHALYAFRNILGKVRIVDRYGEEVANLSELATKYPGIETANVIGATFVKNAQIVQLLNGASAVAVEVRAVMLADRKTADAKFTHFKMMRDAGYSASTAARPHKSSEPAKTIVQPIKPDIIRPVQPIKPSVARSNSKAVHTAYLHNEVTVRAGDTWESVVRPFYDNKRTPMPFNEFVKWERATNQLMGNVPDKGPPKPGTRVRIY
jgi:hypothetical protein